MSNSRAGRDPEDAKTTPLPPGKTYFLGIGINAYQHWPKLRNAVRDVEAIAALLTTDFGLAPEHATLLLDTQATEEQIIHQLEVMADTVTERDSLLIYYAGHGYLHRGIRGFWVPVDAPREKIPRLIRNSTIRDYIGDIPSLHTLLISDSCFSGSLFVRGERREELKVDELATLPSRWAITSGRLDEPVADGPKDGHSPFARSILDVLSMPSRDRITSNFLYEQVREQTIANGYQMPDGGPLAGVSHKRGQYVFRRGVGKEQLTPDLEKLDELTKLRQALAERDALLQRLQQGTSPTPASPKTTPEKEKVKGEPEINSIQQQATTPTPANAKPELKQEKVEGEPEMVFIQGGTFEMGDVMGDDEFENEKPIHQVTLSDFYLGRFAVTQEEYAAFREATAYHWLINHLPVTRVKWYDAVAYCNWLSEQLGYMSVYTIKGENVTANWEANGYRLPTEAEWEFAARQRGEKVRFGNGKNVADSAEINFNGSKSFKKKYSIASPNRNKDVPVGSLNSPNSLGLHDMSGNVWEWCGDWFGDYYPATQINPRGPMSGSGRVRRGGGWGSFPQSCRAAYRLAKSPKESSNDCGFRLARNS